MRTSKNLAGGGPKKIPRWLAYILFSLVWGVLPWIISLLTPRFGWLTGRPGLWNGLGLVPLVVGIAGSLWTLHLHFAGSGKGLEWEPSKTYLLTRGPYSFSRNPMYLFELTLIFGWAVFYGSISVSIAFLGWWAWFSFSQVPLEERVIEARFGKIYTDYKSRVPRWLGRLRR